MNIHHHPAEDLLFDYAAGSLGESWSLAVATHLALCPECRRSVIELDALGGGLIDAVPPVEPSAGLFDAVMERLDGSFDETGPDTSLHECSVKNPILPEPLRGYLGGDVDQLSWQRLGLGAHQLLITSIEDGASARLLRIPAGRPVPTHTHGGRELTLVLAGAFSDDTGIYGRGDLQEVDENVEHQPHAAPGEDCICLAVTDTPLRFKSRAARIVQPLIGI